MLSISWIHFISMVHMTAVRIGIADTSRHTVMCQWPRKPCDSQVCYLQEPLTRRFQPLISYNHWADFNQIHIFYVLHIRNLTYQIWKKLAQSFARYMFLTIALFSSPFSSYSYSSSSSSHRFTKVHLSQPKTPFPFIDFFQIWHTYEALLGLS